MQRAKLLLASLLAAFAQTGAHGLHFKPDGTFKIIHVSDAHWHTWGPCKDLPPGVAYHPCGHKNTTDLVSRVIEQEKPDAVIYTGDIVDSSTHPSQLGMSYMYGAAFSHQLPWAATLGNHDGNSNLDRKQVVEYFLGLPGTIAQMGPDRELGSYGNYHLDIFANGSAAGEAPPLFRFWHLDADWGSDVNQTVNPRQVGWYRNQSAEHNPQGRPQVPALMFFHVPLQEYDIAAKAEPISGEFNEGVSYGPDNNNKLFEAIREMGDVKATFVGHDHTNDFCVLFQGVQLCYEGSPGYQGYGLSSFPRRCRVTELRKNGCEVWSWKRLANGTAVDHERLWSCGEGEEKGEEANLVGADGRYPNRRRVHTIPTIRRSQDDYLPRRRKKRQKL